MCAPSLPPNVIQKKHTTPHASRQTAVRSVMVSSSTTFPPRDRHSGCRTKNSPARGSPSVTLSCRGGAPTHKHPHTRTHTQTTQHKHTAGKHTHTHKHNTQRTHTPTHTHIHTTQHTVRLDCAAGHEVQCGVAGGMLDNQPATCAGRRRKKESSKPGTRRRLPRAHGREGRGSRRSADNPPPLSNGYRRTGR